MSAAVNISTKIQREKLLCSSTVTLGLFERAGK